MAKNRLFVDEIVSIGLVESPDNPGAEVLIYKAKAAEPWSLAKSQKQLEETRKERRQRQLVDTIAGREKEQPMSQTPITDGLKKAYAPKPTKAVRIPTPATDALVAKIEKDRARARGEEVPDSIDEMIDKKLEAFAQRVQIGNEIAGTRHSQSRTRAEQVTNIRSAWWSSPDGRAVTKLLRDPDKPTGDGEAVVKSVERTHAAAHAAIGRLDG